MEKRVEIVVGDDILFPRFAEDREQDEKDFVAEKAVFNMAIEGDHSGVILARVGRALLEIKREKAEPVPGALKLGRAAGKVQELEDLPTVLLPIAIVG